MGQAFARARHDVTAIVTAIRNPIVQPRSQQPLCNSQFDDACDLFVACLLLSLIIVPAGLALSVSHASQGRALLACGFVVFVCGTLCNLAAAAIGFACWKRRADLRALTLWLAALAAAGSFLALSLGWWTYARWR
jgi:hypothetical protein